MMISEQFKSLDLNKTIRKLCTKEVGGLKMKNNEKNAFCNLKKRIF